MDEEEGAVQRSGKLLVLQQILPLWHKQVGLVGVLMQCTYDKYRSTLLDDLPRNLR